MAVLGPIKTFKWEFHPGFPGAPSNVVVREEWRYKPLPLPVERLPLRYLNEITRCSKPVRLAGREPRNYSNAYGFLSLPAQNTITNGAPVGPFCKAAYAKAWARLQDKILGDTASIGVTVAEGRDAITMIVDRATRLRAAYSALRKGRFRDFLKQIGGRPLEHHKKTKWTRPKDASAIWLEYWLGWAPSVADIQNAMKTLTSEHLLMAEPWHTLKGSAKVRYPSDGVNVVSGVRSQWGASNGFTKVVVGCQVKVENPNRFLANRLGLLDWAGTAHAVIPFSFIAGWFNNVESVLRSFTLFAGLAVRPGSAYVQVTSIAKMGYEEQTQDYSPPTGVGCSGFSLHSKRDLVSTFATPNVIWQLPKTLSVTRAATAISLLVSIFTKG